MNLYDACLKIALAAGLDGEQLYQYALEDNVGGRDTRNNKPAKVGYEETDWPGMSVFAAEGQILYALIRAMKPRRVLEIGVDTGGTTTHILTALEKNITEVVGKLISVDINPNMGRKVPSYLHYLWEPFVGDAAKVVPFIADIDFVWEDGPHSLEWTTNILRLAKEYNPMAILSHDAVAHKYMPGDFHTLEAFKAALGTEDYVLTEGSISGICYWFRESV